MIFVERHTLNTAPAFAVVKARPDGLIPLCVEPENSYIGVRQFFRNFGPPLGTLFIAASYAA